MIKQDYYVRRLLHSVIKVLNVINIFLVFPFLVVLILADIGLRSFLGAPISWAHEVSGLLLICLFFLSLPGCIQSRSLLKVDFAYQFMSQGQKHHASQLSSLLLLLFSLLLTVQGYFGVQESLEYDERAYTINIPYWPFYVLISFVGAISAFQSVYELCNPGESHTIAHDEVIR